MMTTRCDDPSRYSRSPAISHAAHPPDLPDGQITDFAVKPLSEGQDVSGKPRATPSIVIAREGGRSSIPETSVIKSRGRGVLDASLEPVIGLAEGETRWRGMTNP
jgi:hypothetical protein